MKNIAKAISIINIPRIDVKLHEYLKIIADSIPKIDESFYELFKGLSNEYIGEKLQQKVEFSRKWADYGWVLYGNMSVPDIYNPPSTQKEADLYMMRILQEDQMLIDLDGVKNNIDELIYLYEHQRYISCVMLTLNAIERILLGHMKFDVNEIGLIYRIGNKKSKEASFFKLEDYEKMAITYLNANNIIFLIDKTFKKYGDNWDNEPSFVVRDYINHGMSELPGSQTDVVKLILLLIEFSDWSDTVIKNITKKQSTNGINEL